MWSSEFSLCYRIWENPAKISLCLDLSNCWSTAINLHNTKIRQSMQCTAENTKITYKLKK